MAVWFAGGVLVFCLFKNYSRRMTKSAKIFVGISLLGLCLLATYVFIFDQTLFIFQDLEVTVVGDKWHKDILEQKKKRWSVRLLAHKNKNLWQVPLAQFNQELQRDPSVLSSTVDRVWPNRVRIQLRLKPILLVFLDGRQTVLPITADGKILEKIDLVYAPDVPFVRNRQLLKNLDTLSTLIALYITVPEEGVISKPEVAEVDWTTERGLLLEMSHGIEGQIVLGHKDVHLKAKRVANVLKYLESQNQKWRVIDASFAKKVLVRLRKHS